ncbi:MAG: efflux RND transporter periplasmic adaptor subunit [Marinifilaceae bacterium]
MKRLLFVILSTAVMTACNQKETDLSKDISVPVSVLELQPKTIEKYISTTGTVNPVKTVNLKSEIAGNYKLQINPATGRPYALGDQVKEGADVIVLEDKEYENNIKLSSLELRLQISKQVYEKQQSLHKMGGVTLTELKNAEIDYINAKYSYEDGLLRMAKMKVKAPFSGILTDLTYYTPNTRVAANSPMLALMDYSKLHMEINLAEKNINMVKTGQEVRIMNYTIPDDTLKGNLSQMSPAIDAETRSFKAVVDISNSELLLRPGMFAKGEIVVASVDSAIVIPKEVIQSKQRGNTVFVINKGLAQERIISFGLENPAEVQVISGLDRKDRLVVKGFETLRNRSKVKVVK